MLWIFGIVLGIGVAGSLVAWSLSAPRYDGAKTAHFDGVRFTNPDGIEAKGFGDLLKWAFNRERGSWTRLTDVPKFPGPEPTVDHGTVRITFVNHSTFLIQGHGINILTDPIWSERASPFQWAGPRRMRPPGIAFEDLPHIHAVVLSHNHYDHLDVHTVRRLCKTYDPVFYVPLGVAAYVQKLGATHVHELDWWQEVEMARGVRLTAVPANHFSGRGSADRDATLWCGYVIGMQAGRVYFAGDTGYGTFFPEIAQRCGAVDIAMLPIGSYKPRWFMSPIHTSPEEAVAIHKEVGARYSIGMHFGTFPLGDDGQTDPVVDLGAALRQKGVAADRFVTLEEGKAFDYSGGRAEQ